MGKYDDFDLDLNMVKGKGEIEPQSDVPSLGAICTLISGIIIGSVVTGCSDTCVTNGCSIGCPVPSRDYPHHSCNKALAGDAQLRC